jgi:hypothetical protein
VPGARVANIEQDMPQQAREEAPVKVTKLVSTCDVKDCPTIYATDRGTLLVQGETPNDHGLTIPGHETIVEIPTELLLGLLRKGISA